MIKIYLALFKVFRKKKKTILISRKLQWYRWFKRRFETTMHCRDDETWFAWLCYRWTVWWRIERSILAHCAFERFSLASQQTTLFNGIILRENNVYCVGLNNCLEQKGVGFAVDLVVCSALGVDMFDCVFPTRTARFGMALVPRIYFLVFCRNQKYILIFFFLNNNYLFFFFIDGSLKLKTTKFEKDINPIDKDCYCYVCKKFTRGLFFK